jgi:hypothetical protein
MLIEKKEIDLDAAAPILEKLSNVVKAKRVVSLGEFVAINFDALFRSGGSVKQVYEYLKGSGLDVGTYHSFRAACSRARKQRRANVSAIAKDTAESVKMKSSKETEVIHEAVKTDNAVSTKKDESAIKVSKYNSKLPPIMLPGGVEAFTDPETGGKCFEF